MIKIKILLFQALICCFLFSFISETANATCSTPTLSTSGIVGASVLNVSASGVAQIQWYNGATLINTVTATAAVSGITVAGDSFGNSSIATNRLYSPSGVFVDSLGNMYVADQYNHRIQKWAVGATSGITVAGGNGLGNAANQLTLPTGVFVDGVGNVYVADKNNHRIQKWAVGATSGITVAGGNGQGNAANQLNSPFGVFVDGVGNVYVADEANNRIQKWAIGATSGITVAGDSFGNASSTANRLYFPSGVFVDGVGNMYIADTYNNRIQKWLAGATSGITVAGGNGYGSAANQLAYPYGLFIDGVSNIYVADHNNHRIQKWVVGAASGITITGGNGQGSSANQLSLPTSVFVDSLGNIYVADLSNNRIQKWNQQLSLVDTPTSVGSYTAVVTYYNGCVQTSNAVNINQVPCPVPTLSASNGGRIFFDGPPVILSVSTPGAAQIQLYHGGTLINTATAMPDTIGTTVAGGNGQGNAANQFYNPSGVFVDGLVSSVYVADRDNNRIQKWVAGAINGTTVAGGNGQGSAANQLNSPTDVFVDGLGNMYVVDQNNNRIQKWAAGAASGIAIAGGNGQGSSANQLSLPTSVFVDSLGNIYIADHDNNRIQKWAAGATSGTTIAGGNGAGSASNQLAGPTGVFVDVIGNVYVADHDNRRIQKWAVGAISGTTVAGGNGQGSGVNQLNNPFGILVDILDNVYVADSYNNRVQKWAVGAINGTTVAGGNGQGSGVNQLNSPYCVSLDKLGNVYVADQGNNRIQKWEQQPVLTNYNNGPGSYTVVVTYYNGCVQTSDSVNIIVIGIKEIIESLNLNVYPNPTNNQVTLSYTLPTGCKIEMILYDIVGNKVIEVLNEKQQGQEKRCRQLDLSSLNAGMYFLKVTTEQGIATIRLAKQ